MFERSKRGEKALLIQPRRHGVEFDAAAAEFRELARSAGAEVVAELVARIDKPHPALYVGSGKAEEAKALVQSLKDTVRTSCMVMIIVAGAVVFGRFLAVTRIPYELASWLTGLPFPPWVIISLIILFYLIAGCFVDALGLLLLPPALPQLAGLTLQLGQLFFLFL